MRHGAGALRRLDEKSLDEIHRIFEVSGGKEMFDAIEEHSDRKARELRDQARQFFIGASAKAQEPRSPDPARDHRRRPRRPPPRSTTLLEE